MSPSFEPMKRWSHTSVIVFDDLVGGFDSARVHGLRSPRSTARHRPGPEPRQMDGIAIAKRRGVYKGGRARLDLTRVKQLADDGVGPLQSHASSAWPRVQSTGSLRKRERDLLARARAAYATGAFSILAGDWSGRRTFSAGSGGSRLPST